MLPFNLNDALRPIGSEDGPNVALDTRLDNRVLDLRVRLKSELAIGLPCVALSSLR